MSNSDAPPMYTPPAIPPPNARPEPRNEPIEEENTKKRGRDGEGEEISSKNAQGKPEERVEPETGRAEPEESATRSEPTLSPPSPKRRKTVDTSVPPRQTRSKTRVATNGTATAPTEVETPPNNTNIDPSLTLQPSSSKSPPPTTAPPATTNESAAPSTATTSVNPYLNLFLPRAHPNGTPGATPTHPHPMAFANPYMFYGPMTPVTPNAPFNPNGTPTYAYNPYLCMAPMMGYPGMPMPVPPVQRPNVQPTPPSSAVVGTNSAPGSAPATPGANGGGAGTPPASASAPSSDPAAAGTPGPSGSAPSPTPAAPTRKAKRAKAHAVTSKSYNIPLVPRGKDGKPMLPLNVGIMTVISLGQVCQREGFHTERYIFPCGYEVTRRYLSTVDPTNEVVYHCTILDGGDGPKFQIVPSDAPDKPVIAGTATGAWSSIVKTANAIRNRQHSNSVSGPDFFGLGQNTIKHLIQELPNADKLKGYVWQNFMEGGPLGGRHASVIPALPEEYEGAMPRGPVYHTPIEREKIVASGAINSASPGELPKGLSHYPQHIVAQAQGRPMFAHHHPMHHPSHPHPNPHSPHSIHHLGPAIQPPGMPPMPGIPPHLHQQHQQQLQAAHQQLQHAQQQQQQMGGAPAPPAPPPPSGPGQPPPGGHPATFIPNVPPNADAAAAMMAQAQTQAHGQSPAQSQSPTPAPTPSMPSGAAPSIASIMNAYRPSAS